MIETNIATLSERDSVPTRRLVEHNDYDRAIQYCENLKAIPPENHSRRPATGLANPHNRQNRHSIPPAVSMTGLAALPLIRQHGQQQDSAQYDLLIKWIDVRQVHAILDDGDDERANQSSQDAAFATHQ